MELVRSTPLRLLSRGAAMIEPSLDTQALLLLTAPLTIGRARTDNQLLTRGEFKRLARVLKDKGLTPKDLLVQETRTLLRGAVAKVDNARLEGLLGRGFLMSDAIQRWQTRSIWVIGRYDYAYPSRVLERLKEEAPPILYGCGNEEVLNNGGLALMGAERVEGTGAQQAATIGELAGRANRTILTSNEGSFQELLASTAVNAGGSWAKVLAGNLEREALKREHREPIRGGQFVLVSSSDPLAGKTATRAKQRDMLLAALADATVAFELRDESNGLGAAEQRRKLPMVVQFVGAADVLSSLMDETTTSGEHEPNDISGIAETTRPSLPNAGFPSSQRRSEANADLAPAEALFATVKSLLSGISDPKTATDVGRELNVPPALAREWLDRLVDEGVLEKVRPNRYQPSSPRLL